MATVPLPADLFCLATDLAPHAVLIVDGAGIIVYANAKASELFGYPSDELTGRSVDLLVPDPVRGHHAALRGKFADIPRIRAMREGKPLVGRAPMVPILLSR